MKHKLMKLVALLTVLFCLVPSVSAQDKKLKVVATNSIIADITNMSHYLAILRRPPKLI